MGIREGLRNLFGRTAEVEDRVSLMPSVESRSISFQDLWGEGWNFNQVVGYNIDQATRLVPVLAATSLLADLVSGLEIWAYRKKDDQKVPLNPQPPLLDQPTAFGDMAQWLHRYVVSMSLRGNAYGLITSTDRFGYPTSIEWLHPDWVSVANNYAVENPQFFWAGRPIDRSLFVHIPMYTVPGRILGLSPIMAYRDAIETGIMAQRYGLDWFRHGNIPAGIIKSGTRIRDEEHAEGIRKRFESRASRRSIAVMDPDSEFQQISVAPEESQFIETMRMTASQIAAVYHLPPEMVGGESSTSSMTYANIESRRSDIATFAMRPYTTKLEGALKRITPRGQIYRFRYDDFERPEMLTRYSAYHLAIQDRWMTSTEVRAKEEMAPLTSKQQDEIVEALGEPGKGNAVTAGSGKSQGDNMLPEGNTHGSVASDLAAGSVTPLVPRSGKHPA